MLVDTRLLADVATALPLATGATLLPEGWEELPLTIARGIILPLALGTALGTALALALTLTLTLALALALALADGPVQNFWKNDSPSVTPVKSSCVVA